MDKNREGKWKAIQYEGVSAYYDYCKHQSHNSVDCTIKQRDGEKRTKKNLSDA